MRSISRTDLQALLSADNPPVVLEALPPSYFEAGHLPGARNLPLDDINELASTLIPTPTTTVVTYCSGSTCRNSRQAAEQLERLGYRDVLVYEGGKEDWTDAALPLEQDAREVAR